MDYILLQHLLILCCYGGVPFINYEGTSSGDNSAAISLSSRGPKLGTLLRPMDLTDWVAVDEPGQLLNASLHPEVLASDPHLARLLPPKEELAEEVSAGGEPFNLEQCDLYNLTFSSLADEHIFHAMGGRLQCRCPVRRYGSACHFRNFHVAESASKALSKKRDLSAHLPSTATPPAPSSTSSGALLLLAELVSQQRKEGEEQQDQQRPNNSGGLANSQMSLMSPLEHATGGDGQAQDLHAAYGQHRSFVFYLAIMLVFMLAMAALFTMMRGCCWVDCFGGFKLPSFASSRHHASHLADDGGAPLNPAMLDRCLEAVRAHEENEKNKYSTQCAFVDSRRPLIPSVSERCPYQPTTMLPPPNSTPTDIYRPDVPPTRPFNALDFSYHPQPQPPQQQARNPHHPPSTAPGYRRSGEGGDGGRIRQQQPSPPPSYKSLEI